MQTALLKRIQQTAEGQTAESILRACVHCGFCTATCPTYQLLGDELDGPRGRIYLIKQVLEGEKATRTTQQHLERCLTCRACETTCPSGVEYGRLKDIGLAEVNRQVRHTVWQNLQHYTLRQVLPYRQRFGFFLAWGQAMRPLLPAVLKRKVPPKQQAGNWPKPQHSRTMLALGSCAQAVATPTTDAATARVLDCLGIGLIRPESSGCCGAVSQHLDAAEEAKSFMRRNIDAWWPHIEQGAEAIVLTASGCGVLVKEYGELLKDDAEYAAKAAKVSAISKDLSEILQVEDLSGLRLNTQHSVAFHPPCTLQHGQAITGVVEGILQKLGFELKPFQDSHLCCGSAGTYSILQPKLAKQLLNNKLNHLQANTPDWIVTANVGCQLHLATQSAVPVKHWIELLDPDHALPETLQARIKQ
jgi:glycolate oxidase iron-sulfur subunit